MRKRICIIAALVLLIAGVGILMYPTFSNWWNQHTQSQLIDQYTDAVAEVKEEDYSAYLEAAREYNEKLYEAGTEYVLVNPNLVDGYDDLLDVTGNGVIGYVTIPKIDVFLPIYHGTTKAVLQVGVGHVQGSSLPVGGENTHAVISAHTGLPSATLFTHLDQMEIGDTFTITVLNETLTYEVDQISVVLPTEVEYLYIANGEDYCTLMTCTPYGINTHRLLVRGVRVETPEITEDVPETEPELSGSSSPAMIFVIAAFILIVLLILIIILLKRQKRERRKNDA